VHGLSNECASSITGGGYKNILVIGADALSRFVDWTDRGSCILFGDAAGAVLVQVFTLFGLILALVRLSCFFIFTNIFK